jgi:hypothetical protein
LPERKKPLVEDELQKLIAEWPTEVIKKQKKDDRKVRYSIFGSIPPPALEVLVTSRSALSLGGHKLYCLQNC